MLIHAVVPDAFGVGIVIPLLKKVDGNKTSTDNYYMYRDITLSPVISKIFELVTLHLFSSQFESDSLQYGFKHNSCHFSFAYSFASLR